MSVWFRSCTLILLWLCTAGVYAGQQTVRLYVYHQQPPFITGSDEGLSYRLADSLNSLQSEFLYKVTPRPRSRLDHEIAPWVNGQCNGKDVECGDSHWAVLWVCPKWGWGERAGQRFRWVDLMPASNLVISHRNSVVDYKDPASLTGTRLAAISGHYIPGVDPIVEQGRIRRLDGSNYQSLIWRVLQQRADVSIVMDSALNYYLRENRHLAERQAELHVSAQPFQTMILQAMLPADQQLLAQQLRRFTHSPQWYAILSEYQVDSTQLQTDGGEPDAAPCELMGLDD